MAIDSYLEAILLLFHIINENICIFSYMKVGLIQFLFFIILLNAGKTCLAQSSVLFHESFSESTSEEDKFEIYLDSSVEYRYRDVELSSQSLLECARILKQGTTVNDSVYLKYVLAQIYLSYTRLDALSAYEVIAQNENILESEDVGSYQVNLFKYLKNFTLMSLGDFEAAQKAFYEDIEIGKEDKDTMRVINNLYSLAQLFAVSEETDASIRAYNEVLSYVDVFEIPESTLAYTHLELVGMYISTKENEKALVHVNEALDIALNNKLDFILPNLYKEKGKLFLLSNKLDSALYVLSEFPFLGVSIEENNYKENLVSLQAEVFKYQKKYAKALASYEFMMTIIDSSRSDVLLDLYKSAYEIELLRNNHESANTLLLDYNSLKNKIDNDEKRQKTAYLKVKYETEQKELDNINLTAQLYKNQAERNFLFGSLGIAALFLFGLIAAFFQKARYSKQLERTVQKRTENLQQANTQLNKSNEELDELNRILAHDLKEPLRNVLNFSELAVREESLNNKINEYLDIVMKSGKQLNHLIDDVSLLRESNFVESIDNENFELKVFFTEIVKAVAQKYDKKKIILNCDDKSILYGPKQILEQIFHNLVDNATKFNENDEIKIDIKYELNNNQNSFQIKDNGIGIEEKYHDQVFGMFKRLNNRNAYIGSGLGLSIAKRLVNILGGQIFIQSSALDEGTCIIVNYPNKRDN